MPVSLAIWDWVIPRLEMYSRIFLPTLIAVLTSNIIGISLLIISNNIGMSTDFVNKFQGIWIQCLHIEKKVLFLSRVIYMSDEVGGRIQKARRGAGLTQAELAVKIGEKNTTISNWEKGVSRPDIDALRDLAAALSVDADYLLTGNVRPFDAHDVGSVVNFRIMNAVKCGYGAAPVEDYSDDYEQIPADMLNGYRPSDCKVVRVTGDSMYPRIMEGDKVLVHIQDDVESGEVALILYSNGEAATLKKVIKHPDAIELVPANPEYTTKRISGKELLECRIYGRVIKLIRDF
jgi:repressor LexA